MPVRNEYGMNEYRIEALRLHDTRMEMLSTLTHYNILPDTFILSLVPSSCQKI